VTQRSPGPWHGLLDVLRLVAARLGARRGQAMLVAIAVAATILVVGSLFGVGTTAADRAVRASLGSLEVPARSVSILRRTDTLFEHARADGRARAALAPIAAYAAPVFTATLIDMPDDPLLVLAIDDVQRWATATSGRLPSPCDGGTSCETALVIRGARDLEVDLPPSLELGSTTLHPVGTVTMSSELPMRLPDVTAGSVSGILLVSGSAIVQSDTAASEPRTSLWVAALDPAKVHTWSIGPLVDTIDQGHRELALVDASMSMSSPDQIFADVGAQSAVSSGRIVFIGSLIVAVLVAFAVFAGALDRDDVRAEYRRLRGFGAGRRHLAVLVLGEAVVPAIAGTAVGILAAAVAVGWLAASQGLPPGDALAASLLQPAAIAVMLGLALITIVAIGVALHPASGRFLSPRVVALAVLPVVIVLVWDRVTRGAATSLDLAAGGAGPGSVLLPGLLGLAIILLSLALLPRIFRRLARVTLGGPVPLRLATLSMAREPLRPAATLTLLALSFGCAVFGLGYGATLRQGAADAAAFRVGMDLRVTPPSEQTAFVSGVVKPLQAGALGPDVDVQPMIDIGANGPNGTAMTVLGLDPSLIPRLAGWRSDFSSSSAEGLASAIAQPGDWRLAGHPLPDGARRLTFNLNVSREASEDQAPIELRAVIDTGPTGYRTIRLPDLVNGKSTVDAPLLDDQEAASTSVTEPHGWRVVAIVASLPQDVGFVGLQAASVAISGLPELADPAVPVDLELSATHERQVIRGPAPTDGLVLPAIVSPAAAEDITASGILVLRLASGESIQVRPVGVASVFPTIEPVDREFAIVDVGPLLSAINAETPGRGLLNEVLLGVPARRIGQVEAALGTEPFPPVRVESRATLEAQLADDPFAVGIAWTLTVGALAGLALAGIGMLVGARSDLRDDRGELGDLEEQGVRPASLASLAVVRASLLAGLALVSGAVLGLAITWFAVTSIAVTADGSTPVPSLRVVIPWLAALGLGFVLLVALAVATAAVARAHYGARLLREAS
jgi:hypothetical protein